MVGHADHDPSMFRTFDLVSRNGISVYRKPAGTSTASCAAPRWACNALAQTPLAGPTLALSPDSSWLDALPISLDSAPPTPRKDRVGRSVPVLGEVRALADAGDWVKAEILCSDLIEEGPLDPALHFYHALILEQMGRLEEAERSLRRSVYLDRKFVLAHYHLGLLLRRSGSQPRVARQCFENVLALLAAMSDGVVFEHGDGIRAADLRDLTQMNLEGL